MWQLALDTSTSHAVVALLNQDCVEFSWRGTTAHQHSETLLQGVSAGLAQRGITPQQLDFLSVGIGPGAFTGLRIGLVMAKFLAEAWHKPVVGISSLAALALRADHLSLLPQKRIWALHDAKRHEVYALEIQAADINKLSGSPHPSERPWKPEDLAQELKAGDLLLGEGADAFAKIWPAGVDIAPEEFRYLEAGDLGRLGAAKFRESGGVDAATILARYFPSEKF